MQITSMAYILASIVSIFIFYLLNPKYRILFLTLLSSVFIASYSYLLLVYIIFYALINYYLGIIIPGTKFKKAVFRTGLVINLSQLVILRYASFAIDPVFEALNSTIAVSKLSEIIVPLGISYFTLQGIGYLINVKMGWEKPEKNFLLFLLYIIFYPKFLSGPVERSNHFLPQLKKLTVFNEQQVSDGLRLALIGLFKKVAIANQIAPYAVGSYANINFADGSTSWLLFIIQPLYLYFDFSGYTDMARGIAKTFGIELLPNFNRPFFADNVTNFWKRFHISLSSWFNDYVFKQTSFKYRRWGIAASTYAVFLTWILFGIWHGAGWNFMMIGFLQAVAINYEFFTKKIRTRLFSKIPGFITIWFGRILTYLFYCVSLVFFFSPDISSAVNFFSKLSHFSGPLPLEDMSLKPFEVIVYIPVFLLLELIQNDYNETYIKLENSWLADNTRSRIFRWSVYTLLITIIFVVGLKAQQFVYANF
jgi:D-alanyl-lipoteichoic acid acyltransferase DltB (MBOAT superfamily)